VLNSGRGIGLLYRRLNFGRAVQIRQNLKLLFVCYKKGKKHENVSNLFHDTGALFFEMLAEMKPNDKKIKGDEIKFLRTALNSQKIGE